MNRIVWTTTLLCKPIRDTLDTVKIAKKFACASELRKGHFVEFELGYALGLVYDEPPHARSAASAHI